MEVNGMIISAVQTLVSVATDEMSSEKDRLDSVQSLANIPGVFDTEISLVKSEVNSVRDILNRIQHDSMTTARGKIRAANLAIQIETLILRANRK